MESLLQQVMTGFIDICHLEHLAAIALGVFGGITIGALPGLTSTMSVAILTPITFAMNPMTGISMLLGVFCGGIYGGSITAILIRTPGTPAAIATVFDGYPLAQKGMAGQALAMALFASFCGGMISALILIFTAPALAKIALQFGPPEYFGLTVFGISIIASVSGKRLIKGLIAGVFGLLLSTVGMDPVTGVPRFAFGSTTMLSGFSLIPVLIGIFATSEVFYQAVIVEPGKKKITFDESTMRGIFIPLSLIVKNAFNIIRSALIGTFIGVVPGTGGGIAAFIAYSEAKRASKHPEKFGTGVFEGVAAAEAANNATTGGALIPMLTLGIPGDPVTAVLMGAFMMQGLLPGPLLIQQQGQIVFALFAGLIIANIMMLGMGILGIRFFSKIIKIPMWILSPTILCLCFVGSYAVANNMVDVAAMLALGMVGFFMRRHDFPGAPIVIAFILGPLVEKSLRQSLTISQGSWNVFVTSYICIIFLILTVFSVAFSIYRSHKRETKEISV